MDNRPLTIINYGVWIKGLGWLKRDGACFATDHKEIAQEVAGRVKGKVYFIDSALPQFEASFLEMEKSQVKGIRAMFSAWMKRLQSK